MYIVVREYRGEARDVVQQAAQRQESLKAAIRGIPGLVAYYGVDTGDSGVTSVSVFEDRAGAEESIRVAAAWVREHLAQWAPNPPTIIQGEVFIDIAR